MRESELGDALRSLAPEPELSDIERLEVLRKSTSGLSPRPRWANVGLAVAAAVVLAGVVFWALDAEPEAEVATSTPQPTRDTSVPTGALRCVAEGTDYYPEVGKITPDPVEALLCSSRRDGSVDGDQLYGQLAPLVAEINGLVADDHDFSWCVGGRNAYVLVFGYSDGHTEVVRGTPGGECDLLSVNGIDKSGAGTVLQMAQELSQSVNP